MLPRTNRATLASAGGTTTAPEHASSGELTGDSTAAPALALLARIPARVRVLLIYVVSRGVAFGFFAGVYAIAPALQLPYANFGRTRPSLLAFMSAWDGTYYRQIALHGYPTTLPLDATGHVVQNAWAFLPVYSWLTRGLMVTTGLGFTPAGIILSLIFGAAAAALLFRLLAPRIGDNRALWSVAFFCLGPMSFIMLMTYAESLFVALMFASVLLIQQRRYLLAMPIGVIAAFTRPGALAIAATIGILLIAQLVRRERIAVGERVRMIVAGVVITAAGFAWPFIANAVTGQRNAYFNTELSWWTLMVGRVRFIPFAPWFEQFYHFTGIVGPFLVIGIIVGFIVWMARREMRVLGDEILAYSGSYGAYLLATFLPQQSIARLLLPMAPLFGTPLFTRSPRWRWGILVALIVLQPGAIASLWFIYPP